jgi:hypothetical protein
MRLSREGPQIGFLRAVISSSPVTQSSGSLTRFELSVVLLFAFMSMFPNRSR